MTGGRRNLRGIAEHVVYEVEMLRFTGHRLGSDLSQPEQNAFLESFSVHARALVQFLYRSAIYREGDVLAEHFFTSPEVWRNACGTMPPVLDLVAGRVGKEIAHLTYRRAYVEPEAKGWRVPAILAELERLVRLFASLAPTGALSDEDRNRLRGTETAIAGTLVDGLVTDVSSGSLLR